MRKELPFIVRLTIGVLLMAALIAVKMIPPSRSPAILPETVEAHR